MDTLFEAFEHLKKLGATFAGTANLCKWDDNSKGSFVKFALNQFQDGELIQFESPFKGCKEGAKDGQEFYVLCFMAPKQVEPASSSVTGSDDAGEAPHTPRQKREWKPSNKAGMLISSPDFWAFSKTNNKDEANEWLKLKCGVSHKRDILPNTQAAIWLEKLDRDFDAFLKYERQS